jgi:hypothetical protein
VTLLHHVLGLDPGHAVRCEPSPAGPAAAGDWPSLALPGPLRSSQQILTRALESRGSLRP